MERILLIDDDAVFHALVEGALSSYELSCCTTVRQFEDSDLGLTSFVAVIIDINLPDGDGLTLVSQIIDDCTAWRIPIIIVSSENEISKKFMAFGLGVDDYLTKPFDPMELRLRVESKIRKNKQNKEVVVVGDSRISHGSGCIEIRTGEQLYSLDLTRKESQILLLLAKSPGQVYSRDGILDQIWYNSHVNDRTVDSHITKLRAKISMTGLEIITHKGLGYSLVGK
jgi:DNA-binding response OmpR family regulator